MAKTVCLDCGAITNGSRCPECASRKDRKRQAARGDRYGQDHRALRREWLPHVRAGIVACTRCGELIRPDDPFDLDHRPHGSFPAHQACNRAAGARNEV